MFSIAPRKSCTPRDDYRHSLRYILLKYKADKAYNNYLLAAYDDVQKTNDRLIENSKYYDQVVQNATIYDFFWIGGESPLDKANKAVVESTAQYNTAIVNYEYLLKIAD